MIVYCLSNFYLQPLTHILLGVDQVHPASLFIYTTLYDLNQQLHYVMIYGTVETITIPAVMCHFDKFNSTIP